MDIIQQLAIELSVNMAAFEGGLSKATLATKAFGRDVQRAFSEMANSIGVVTASFGLFGAEGAAVSQVILRMGEAVGYATKSFASMNPVLGFLSGGIAGLAAGVGSLTAALVGLGEKTAESNAKLYIQSISAGVSFEQMQRFAAAAKIAGVESGNMARNLEMLERSALRAAESGNYNATSWGRAGINVLDANKKLKSGGDLLLEVSKVVSKIPDEGERTARAMELMGGRIGIALLPLLMLGDVKIKEFGDFAERSGAVMSTAAGQGAQEFYRSLMKIDVAIGGIRNQLSSGMVQGMTELATAFEHAAEHGNTFEVAGRHIGNMLHDLILAVHGTKDGITSLGLEYEKFKIIQKFGDFDTLGKPIESWKEMKKALAEINDQLQKNQVASKAWYDEFNKPGPPAPASMGTGTGTNIKGRERHIRPEEDPAHDIEVRLAREIANTTRLASELNVLTSSLVLQNAEEKARNEILATQDKLTREITLADRERRQLEAENNPQDAVRLQNLKEEINLKQQQQRNLVTDTQKIIELSQRAAVQEEVKTSGSSTDEFLAKKQRDAKLAGEAAIAPALGPERELTSDIDKVVAKQTDDFQRAGEAINHLLTLYPNLAAAMAPYVALLRQKNEELQASRGAVGEEIVYNDIKKVTEQFDKENTAIEKQISSTVRLAEGYRAGGKALADAQISQELTKDQEKIDDLQEKINALGVVSPQNADQMKELAAALALANDQLSKRVDLLEKEKISQVASSVARQGFELRAKEAEEDITSRYITAPPELQREAAGEAALAKFDVENPEFSPVDEQTEAIRNQIAATNSQIAALQSNTQAIIAKTASTGGNLDSLPRYADGGPVTETGPALVHKGEHVLTKDEKNIWDSMKVEQAGAGAGAGTFETAGSDLWKMIAPIFNKNTVQDPEKFKQAYESLSPEQQEAVREKTQRKIAGMSTKTVDARMYDKYRQKISGGMSSSQALAENSLEVAYGMPIDAIKDSFVNRRKGEFFGHLLASVAVIAASKLAPEIGEFGELPGLFGEAVGTSLEIPVFDPIDMMGYEEGTIPIPKEGERKGSTSKPSGVSHGKISLLGEPEIDKTLPLPTRKFQSLMPGPEQDKNKDTKSKPINLNLEAQNMPSFASGGPITQTGPALVHEGEYVLPAGLTSTFAALADSIRLVIGEFSKFAGVLSSSSKDKPALSVSALAPVVLPINTAAGALSSVSGQDNAGNALAAEKEQTRSDVRDQAIQQWDLENSKRVDALIKQHDLTASYEAQNELLGEAQQKLIGNAVAVERQVASMAAEKYLRETPGAQRDDSGYTNAYNTALAAQQKADSQTLLGLQESKIANDQKELHDHDQILLKSTKLTDNMKGLIGTLKEQGQNTNVKVFEQLTSTIDQAESSLAKFIVTGRGGFNQVLQQMEQSLIKIVIQAALAKVELLALAAVHAILKALHIDDGGASGNAQQAAKIGVAQSARQAFIGEAAAEAAASAALGGPLAAIEAALETEGALQAVTALASGGDTKPGQMYVVGEEGPELFSGGSGHVFTNAELSNMGSALPGQNYLAGEQRAASTPSRGESATPRQGSDSSQGHTVHVNTQVHAVDASGFDDLLEKHSRVVSRHVDNALRKSNQRIS